MSNYYDEIESKFEVININNEHFKIDSIDESSIIFTKDSTELDNTCFSSVFELLSDLGIKKYRLNTCYEVFTMFLTIETDVGDDYEIEEFDERDRTDYQPNNGEYR